MRLCRAAVVALATCAAGCHRDPPAPKTSPVSRRIVASMELERTTESPRRVAAEVDQASEEAERQHQRFVESLARERKQYRNMLAKELALIDVRVAEMEVEAAYAQGSARVAKQRDVAAARSWRAALERDMRAIDAAGEEDWGETRERIDHDIDEGRPPAIPRSFAKSLAI